MEPLSTNGTPEAVQTVALSVTIHPRIQVGQDLSLFIVAQGLQAFIFIKRPVLPVETINLPDLKRHHPLTYFMRSPD